MTSDSRSNRDREEEPRRPSREEREAPSRGRDRDAEPAGRSRSRGRDDEPVRDRGRDRNEEPAGRGRSRGGYEYHARDDESAKKRATQGGGDFDRLLIDGVKGWKPNDKDNRIRILPPTWPGAKHFGLDVYVHYGVGPDRNSYLCLNKMKGLPDPIAEEYAILKRDARNDADDKAAKELSPKPRVLVYLIDRDHEKDGVQAWMMPAGLDKDIVKVSIDKDTGEVLPIDHPDDGYDVSFEKNGQGMTTKYEGVAIARRSSPLGRSEWMEYAVDNPLPDQLNFYSYEHIAGVFNGGGALREPDRAGGKGDRDEAPAKERTRHQEPVAEAHTWESVNEMTWEELEDLIEIERLKIDSKKAEDEADLAEWVCEEMEIKKTVKPSGRRVVTKDDESTTDRLSRLRANRD